MDPELVALILVFAAGTTSWFTRSAGPTCHWGETLPAAMIERRARGALVRPLIPLLCAASFVTGWAMIEPPIADEIPPRSIIVIAILYGLVVLRAGARAIRSARARADVRTAGVVGLLRPRVVLDHAFAAQLDEEARFAVVEHEAAHARGYDPLRILAAQFIADVQWPSRHAPQRLHAWREALEVARDEEARLRGADGAALASAVLQAARAPRSEALVAAVSGAAHATALRLRIARLLAPVPVVAPQRRPLPLWFVAALALVAMGALSGDPVLGVVCRVLP